MYRKVLGCFLSLSLVAATGVQAQSRKSVRKTEKESAAAKRNASAEPAKTEKKRRKKRLDLPDSRQRDRYRIDVLVPLYLDELVKENKVQKSHIPEKAMAGLYFYEGVRLAVDTLASMGYSTDIFVHDIAEGSAALLNEDSLGKTDLIIGFVPTNEVAPVAKFAQEHTVNFVSAFSPSDAGISNNPYFFLINPTLEHNCEALAKAIAKRRSKEFMVVYKRQSQNLDSAAFSFLLDSGHLKNFAELSATTPPDSAAIASAIDLSGSNMIVMPVMDPGYALSLLSDLHHYFPEARFEVFGMPTWKSIVNDRRVLAFGDHIAINITQPYYFDPTVSAGSMLSERYRQTYSGKAGELTYRGFELSYWMVDLLNKYGTLFNEKTGDNGMAIFTKFDIKPKWDADNNFYYFENTNLYLYRYVSGSVLVE
ncbi:hypothetical protein [Rurimicrobium arvi]|uniref:ABC transporter substrate-binding protein n=1 Tax=Rurimicrobium arvi TaxID=2049916 RepID=UPI0031D80DB2